MSLNYHLGAGLNFPSNGSCERPEPHFYWRSSSEWKTTPKSLLNDQEAIEQVENTLRAAISDQMHADVPVGVFLSGGIDSSLVTAYNAVFVGATDKELFNRVPENSFNEAPYGKGCCPPSWHSTTEYYLSSQETLDVISSLAEIYSEPFADSCRFQPI